MPRLGACCSQVPSLLPQWSAPPLPPPSSLALTPPVPCPTLTQIVFFTDTVSIRRGFVLRRGMLPLCSLQPAPAGDAPNLIWYAVPRLSLQHTAESAEKDKKTKEVSVI